MEIVDIPVVGPWGRGYLPPAVLGVTPTIDGRWLIVVLLMKGVGFGGCVVVAILIVLRGMCTVEDVCDTIG